jgi:hypothetical protein
MDKHLFAPTAILLTAVALAACGNDSESATTNPHLPY